MRHSASQVLGQIPDLRSVEPVLALLQDKEVGLMIRGYAAEALGKIGDRRAVQALLEALNEKKNRVEGQQVGSQSWDFWEGTGFLQWQAAQALGKLGDWRAVMELLAVVCDRSQKEEVGRRAFASLFQLAPQADPIPVTEAILKIWPHVQDRETLELLYEVLTAFGPYLRETDPSNWTNWRQRLMPPTEWTVS